MYPSPKYIYHRSYGYGQQPQYGQPQYGAPPGGGYGQPQYGAPPSAAGSTAAAMMGYGQPQQASQYGGQYGASGMSLSGSISTILTVLSWLCVSIHMCGALPCPVCA